MTLFAAMISSVELFSQRIVFFYLGKQGSDYYQQPGKGINCLQQMIPYQPGLESDPNYEGQSGIQTIGPCPIHIGINIKDVCPFPLGACNLRIDKKKRENPQNNEQDQSGDKVTCEGTALKHGDSDLHLVPIWFGDQPDSTKQCTDARKGKQNP